MGEKEVVFSVKRIRKFLITEKWKATQEGNPEIYAFGRTKDEALKNVSALVSVSEPVEKDDGQNYV